VTEITEADCNVAEYIAGDRARDLDYQVVAHHRQYGYDQGYYDGRKMDGMEERAKIVAWLRKNAKLNPHMPEAKALVLLFSEAIKDGVHLQEQSK
jgi:hypothetical protein